MGGSSGYTLPEDFDPVGEGWTPPVSVQRRGVVAPPADYRPGIDPEWNYFGSTLDPIDDPTAPVTDPIYTYPGIPPTYSPGWNPYDVDLSDLGIQFQENGGGFNLGDYMPDFTMPEIDYDLLAGAMGTPSFDMPDYTDLNQQLLDLQGGLGGLEAQFQDFQMPTFEMPDLDYDLLASNINMPTFEMPDYTQQFENLQTGLGGLGTQIGGFQMPSFEFPDYTQQFENLGTTLGGFGTQLGNFQTPTFEIPDFDYDLLAGNIAGNINMPSYEIPDYSQLFENLQTGIGGLGTQIGNMPSFDIPDYNQLFQDLQGSIGGLGTQIGGLQMPSYEIPDYSQLFENLQTGIGGLGTQIGGLQMPSYETPDYTQLFQDLQGSIGGLGTQIGGLQMPSFDMPDYTQAFENLQSGIGGLGSQIGNMPSFDMPNYNQQFENLQQQIGGLGYGGPSLEDIQGIMPSYQGYGGPSLEDIQGIMPSYQGYGGPSLEDIQGIMPSYQMPDYSQDLSAIMSGINALQPQQYVPENPYGTSGWGFAKGGKIPRHQEGKGIAGIARELGGSGGEEAMMTEGNEQLIQATVQAILGMLPDQQTADVIIQKFIGLYGHESFLTLREQVLNPDGQAQTEGLIEGFGGGMDDFVPGIAGSQEKIATSPGEYIIPADVVSQLGDGNSNEGSRMLDGMSERVRMAKTGTIEQAEPIDSKKVLPA